VERPERRAGRAGVGFVVMRHRRAVALGGGHPKATAKC
jgi:hypothetical protein